MSAIAASSYCALSLVELIRCAEREAEEARLKCDIAKQRCNRYSTDSRMVRTSSTHLSSCRHSVHTPGFSSLFRLQSFERSPSCVWFRRSSRRSRSQRSASEFTVTPLVAMHSSKSSFVDHARSERRDFVSHARSESGDFVNHARSDEGDGALHSRLEEEIVPGEASTLTPPTAAAAAAVAAAMAAAAAAVGDAGACSSESVCHVHGAEAELAVLTRDKAPCPSGGTPSGQALTVGVPRVREEIVGRIQDSRLESEHHVGLVSQSPRGRAWAGGRGKGGESRPSSGVGVGARVGASSAKAKATVSVSARGHSSSSRLREPLLESCARQPV